MRFEMIIGTTNNIAKINSVAAAIDKLDFITTRFMDNNLNSLQWYLNDTSYLLVVQRYGLDAGKIYWKEMINGDLHFKYISFEKILSSVSPEIQTKLLFNLDLFR